MVLFQKLLCLLLGGFSLTIYFPTNYALQLENTARPEVTILQGILLGTTLTTRRGRDISAFLGIPYAKPPTGNLRFANPVPADAWNGTRDGRTAGSECPQYLGNAIVGDEDCLYINVFTPQLPKDRNASLLPVMVYIHGGAFKMKFPARNGPEYLLDADVVLVELNYRLGPLGFLSTGDEVASGNWGLKDQVLALKWVQDNIQDFGGDPGQVTIFGHSAGAASIHILTLSNATIGLFHRCIMQSGSALSPWAHRPRTGYSKHAYKLGDFVGCSNDSSDHLISCLRTKDFLDILATKSQLVMWEFLPDIMWGPTDEPDVEGAVLTDSPSNLFAAGKIRDIPWISGVVRDEGLFHSRVFYEDETMLHDFMDNIDAFLPVMLCWTYQPDSGAAWTNAAKSYYFNNDPTSNRNALVENLTMLISDSQFFYPVHKTLQLQNALAVNPQYFYVFNYRDTNSNDPMSIGSVTNHGISHGDELVYIFPRSSTFSGLKVVMSETDFEIVDTMVQLWTSFAINGTPTASDFEGNVKWEPYSTEDNYLKIGNDADVGLETEYSFFEERMQFWTNIDAAP